MKKIYLIPIIIILFMISGCDFNSTVPCVHEYKIDSVIEPTCQQEGKRVEVCLKCEDTISTILPMTEHTYERVEVQATCQQEGKVFDVCSVCKNEILINTLDKKTHKFHETVFLPTCENEGYTKKACLDCPYEEITNIVPALKHDFSEWTLIKEPTEISDGLQTRKCFRCDYIEEDHIISSSYIDMSIIRESFDSSITYDVDSYEKLLLLFECAILNMSNTLNCRINFECESFDELVNSLISDESLLIEFRINVKYSNKIMTFTFTYTEEPNLKTHTTYYTQYNSLNYNPIVKQRDDDFDEFMIENSVYSYNVKTSDQLFYVLEHGAKPICQEGSTADILYKELKKILINIVHDEMTDLEKVKAIHDYLVMNVVYDNELLLKVGSGDSNIKYYHGFYLEGVLLDKKAVCEGISKTFTALCNIEGIPCVTVEGYQSDNPNGVGHAWNKVFVNNDWYIVDVTSDGTIINNSFEILTYKYFLIDDATYQKKYTGTTFTNIECTKNINPYRNMFFTYQGTTYDFNIESQEELNIVVAYFESNGLAHSTIEFRISFECGESFLDEVSKAYQNNHITKGYSYLDNPGSFMLINK